jgi:hypothetical protein
MEVRLSGWFDERIRAVDPARVDTASMRAALMLVSLRGAIAEKSVADSWAKGTFPNPVDSLEYHFNTHGNGRTRWEYTFDALRFFYEYKEKAQWGKWHPRWNEAFRLKIGTRRGYFTPGGRILSFWDDHEDGQATL